MLAQKASSNYDPSRDNTEDRVSLSRQTIDLFVKFLTSRTGIFLKKPLVHELAEAIDGMASIGEANLFRLSRGLFPVLPGMKGPVNERRMEEIRLILETFQSALLVEGGGAVNRGRARMDAFVELAREVLATFNDERFWQDAGPVVAEVQSVVQLVAVEVLEIRGSRAMRALLGR